MKKIGYWVVSIVILVLFMEKNVLAVIRCNIDNRCLNIEAKRPMILVSQMPEHGVIFSDGIESDFLAFNAGTQAED